jgi:hypothetical protein
MMYWIRRLHMYIGLFLLPWALMYGVTAYLFNHPSAFGDAPMTYFGREAADGTELEALPNPAELAGQVVESLNARKKPAVAYKLVNAAQVRFSREFAFATVKGEGEALSILVDVVNGGGTIRVNVNKPPPESVLPPFASARPANAAPSPFTDKTKTSDANEKENGRILLAHPLHQRIKNAIPTILERASYPVGVITITSVPDVVFQIEADGRVWTANYNAMTGNLTGKPADSVSEPLSARQFLLQLHTAHGYPGAQDIRWYWAIMVDVVAFVFVFWGISGILMWWQLKATRGLGLVLLILGMLSAVGMTLGMFWRIA